MSDVIVVSTVNTLLIVDLEAVADDAEDDDDDDDEDSAEVSYSLRSSVDNSKLDLRPVGPKFGTCEL